MRTWILCADRLCAKIFVKKEQNEEPCLCRTIPRKEAEHSKRNSASKRKMRKFVSYVVEEVKIACGAGTESCLIVCAESEILSEYLDQLRSSVGNAIIGTIDQNLCDLSESLLFRFTQSICVRV